MGKRGPAPTPTAVKLMHGETRPSRVNRDEPVPGGVISTTAPTGMSDEGRSVWRRIVREFAKTDVLRAADSDVLRIYCETVGRYEKASQLLDQSGPLVRGARHGELVKNPLHQIVRDNAVLIRQLAGELGLTPAARVGLVSGVKGKSMEDEIDDAIGQPARLRIVEGAS